MSEKFWSNNVSILITPPDAYFFIPSTSYNMVENLNAITRFFLYLSIFLVLMTKNKQNFGFFILAMLVTYFLYHFYPEHMTNIDLDESQTHAYPYDQIKKENADRLTMSDPNQVLREYQDDFNPLSKEDYYKDMGDSAEFIFKIPKGSCKEDAFNCGV